MSRSIKRACAGLSAAALTFSLLGGLGSATAWADDAYSTGDPFAALTCPVDGNATLAIGSPRVGDPATRTFTAYKLANVKQVGGTATTAATSYEVTSAGEGVDTAIKKAFTDAGVTFPEGQTAVGAISGLASDTAVPAKGDTASDGGWKTVPASDIRKVTTQLAKATDSLGSGIAVNGTSTQLEPGVYLVIDTTTATNETRPSVSVPMIVSTEWQADREGNYCYIGKSFLKSNDTTITKTVTEGTDPSAFNGKEVSFTLTVPVPSRTGYDAGSFIFYIADQLPEGLTYKTGSAHFNGGSAEIKPATVDGKLVWNFSDRTIKNGENIDGLTFDKDVSSFSTLLNTSSKPSTITIIYQATISDGAKFVDGNTGNTNTATVTYTNGPDSYYHGEDTAKTYQGEFTINKVDSDQQALAGATFQITSGTDYDKTVVDGGDGDGDGQANGTLTFSDLKATTEGVTYKVSETQAPSGYAKVQDFYVTVKAVASTSDPETYTLTYTITDASGETTTASNVNLTADGSKAGEGKGAATVTDLTTVQNLAHTGGQVAGILALAGVLAGSGVVIGRVRRRTQA